MAFCARAHAAGQGRGGTAQILGGHPQRPSGSDEAAGYPCLRKEAAFWDLLDRAESKTRMNSSSVYPIIAKGTGYWYD